MPPSWTIARVLDWTRQDFAARGIASPRLEAELLIAATLGLPRVALYTRFDQPLKDAELTAVRALIERRRRNEPIAYILGVREFYGRPFAVNPSVLIPRPETEDVVEAALGLLPPAADGVIVPVLDLCAGSGAIAATIACERKDTQVDATEISPEAAAVARGNVEKLGVADRVRVLQGSLYEPVGAAKYALVVSNPPYIAAGEIATLMPDVRDFEPRLALDGGPLGDSVLTPVVQLAREHLREGGVLVVEIGADQGDRARELAKSAGFSRVEVRRDLAGRDRILVVS
ncbi:MAG: peptide chain release factor N(5)-glutamine methyltransferase [Deltaproteobacteria bacterium]